MHPDFVSVLQVKPDLAGDDEEVYLDDKTVFQVAIETA